MAVDLVLLLHLVLLTLLILPVDVDAIEAIPQAADIDTVVNADTSKDVRLEANLYIPDGGELVLGIEVPHEAVKLHSNGPAKIVRVYSDHANGRFGEGEVINVFVQFTSAVQVVGSRAPYLVLRTGCHSSSCHVREIQRLRCQATNGKFALGFDGQTVGNIPWDASTKVFVEYVQRMNKIDKVLVKYSIDENRACTFFGNNITITFESMNIPGIDGNLVEMTGDASNAVGDVSVLGHIMYAPTVTATAWEIQKGVQFPNRRAQFVAQTAPDTLKFAYTVQNGDNSTRLEYASSDSLAVSLKNLGGARILNAGSNTPANVALPPPNFAGDWERGIGTSLSKNSALQIDVTPPFVKSVTSPHADGTFGIGEEILVHVIFSQPIVVSGLPTIVLETGTVDRILPFTQVIQPQGVIAEFRYLVQAMDTSPDLTYTDITALQLNGGYIKRKSTTPTTDANLTLPMNGMAGSLSVSKNMVIDTTNPVILSVTTRISNGVYTAGDAIPVIATFNMPVVVTGTPQLLMNTGSVDLFPGFFVQQAPTATSTNTILFPAVNHGLSTASSRGLQFSIGGKILTVDSVNGNAVTMVETYTGTVVDPTNGINVAQVQIFTPGYRPAVYQVGSATTTLLFLYVVQIGDVSLDLDYTSTSALNLGSGSIKRQSTTPFTDADLTLSIPGSAGSLSNVANVVINTNAPQVLQVNTLSRDGVYRNGDTIFFEVVFDLPVVPTPTASVLTNIVSAGVDRYAVLLNGSGTTSLKFKFDVAGADQVAVFGYSNTNALRAFYSANSGWIYRKSANPMVFAVLDLPGGGMSFNGIAINQNCVVVVDVSTSHEPGTYGVGESVAFNVVYSDNVNVDLTRGTPTILTTTASQAVYQSGSTTTTLKFVYIVQASDTSGPLSYPDTFSLTTNEASITSTATSNIASTILPSPTNLHILIQISPPVVVEVSTQTPDQVLTIGDTIVVSVTFNFPIEVTAALVGAGVPRLLLNVGTGSGAVTSFVAAQDSAVYFTFTIVGGQSTRKLNYFSRTSLQCAGSNGLNKNPGQDAGPTNVVAFANRLFVSWAETPASSSIRQIRVRSFDLSQFPPLSTFEDGSGVTSSINFNSGQDASAPKFVVLSAKLYLLWVEVSSATNNPTQIRVALLSSRSTSSAPAQWAFVDVNPPTSSGINKAVTENAGGPNGVVHNSKLYLAWHEIALGIAQVRVAFYNGIDTAPGWTFVDGNAATRGLNFDATQSAKNIRLCSCASKSSSAKLLYAVWEEPIAATGIQQIRVAVQTGTDLLRSWKFIDGNLAAGLNVNVQNAARLPSIECFGSNSIVIAWQELTTGAASAIFVKKFNGDLTSPQWTRLDSGNGLNFDTTQAAQNIKLKWQRLGNVETLYATWDEVSSASTATQIRVAKLLDIRTSSLWKFMDGEMTFSRINDDATHAASRPNIIVGASQDVLYTFWQEMNGNGKLHVRSSMMNPQVMEWQSLSSACILRKSTTSTTPANLLLPAANTPGSLDFRHSIQIDTSEPTVVGVSLAGDLATSVTSVKNVQTIDVFNVGSITTGAYKLIYGDTSETVCISWNAPATGANSMQAALESIPGLALQVTVAKDSSAFHDGHRYTVIFTFPSMGLQPLRVKTIPDVACQAFSCLPSAQFACDFGLVQINQNSDIRIGAGVVDALVNFSSPVVVLSGTPKLTFETGLTDRDGLYTTRSALQEFDVGINMASPVLGGGFRLSYGDFSSGIGSGTILTTDCIQIFQNDVDAVQDITNKLNAIAVINTIGIQSVSRRQLRNGYRYAIQFRNSGDMLDLVSADSSTCSAVSATTQTIDITADTQIVSGEIMIQLGATRSSCLPWNIRAKGPTNSLENIFHDLDSNRVIGVQVVEDPSIYAHGVKYYVTFAIQSDASMPLLAFTDATCVAFTCAGNVPCTGLSVSSNADFKVSRATSDVLSFQYLVQSSDETTALTYKSPISLTGTILRSSANPTLVSTLTLPPPQALVWEDGLTAISVVSTASIPIVLRVYSTTLAGTYTAGDVIIILVNFSDKVKVDGKPVLELNSNGEAFYISGSDTDTLTFYYEVQPGDSSADLDYASVSALRTFTKPTSRIRCSLCSGSGIDAVTTLLNPGTSSSLSATSALVINTTPPMVARISSSRPATTTGDVGYGPGDIIDIIVTFTNDVTVIGSPSLSLNSGGAATFTYAGYRQLIDIGVDAVTPLTSGQFSIVYDGDVSDCVDFNDPTSLEAALLEYPSLARIGIVSVTMSNVKNGNRFEILFDSSRVVDVPKAVELTVSDVCDPLEPTTTAQEDLISRSMDTQVVFHYTVGTSDTATALDVVSTNIDLDGGRASIMRQAVYPELPANVALPTSSGPQSLAQAKTLKVDGTPAAIIGIVSDTAAGTYGVGFPAVASPSTVNPGEILFHFVYSRAVSVVGSPTVELATGSLTPSGDVIPNRFATFAGQPTAEQVAFLYHIQADDMSANLAFANLNVLQAASIYSASSTMSVQATYNLPRLQIMNPGVLEIDAYSVPATVKLASSHEDGVYGAGELIEIDVTFSKEILLLSGLNTNQYWHARNPVAIEFNGDIYIMWTERDDMHKPTKSFLYLRVFSSATLDTVTLASTSPANRFPNTLINSASMTIWKQNLYAAWDENGLIYCAVFQGLTATIPWTLIPNTGANKNLGMTAGDAVLLVYNLQLVMVWRENSLPLGSSSSVGQIRVAIRNDDVNAPLWLFHDGNQRDSGLNKDPLMDAIEPTAVVYRTRMYVSWSEMNAHGAYEIVIARRNIQTRDISTWTYLDALPSTYPAYTFLSSYNPQFAVRRRGIEDMALLISWYRDTTTSNVSEIITGQVLDLDWEASVTGNIPQTVNAAESNTTFDQVSRNTLDQRFVTCGDSIYSSWLDMDENGDTITSNEANVVKLAVLPAGVDVYTGWVPAVNQSNLNHNTKFDVVDSFLVCSTSATGKAVAGLLWTEYDGYSIKLRFRHSAMLSHIPGSTATTFGEVIAGDPILLLATQSSPLGYAACIDTSGTTSTFLRFTFIVQPGESSPRLEIQGSDALKQNGALIQGVDGQDPAFTLFPGGNDPRSLSYSNQLTIVTTPPVVSSVTAVNPSGEYGVGELLQIQVLFTFPVIVIQGDPTSVPTLTLRSDELHLLASSQGLANYTEGSGSAVLTFEYITTPLDYCRDLDYLDSASLALNGWSLKRNATRPTTDVILTLPSPGTAQSLSGSRTIAIKPTPPSVAELTSPNADGTYYPGDIIFIDVVFTLPVVVFGSPILLLATGATPSHAFLIAGNGTATLRFQYDVGMEDSSSQLDVVDDRVGVDKASFVRSLQLTGYAEILRASTNPFTIAATVLPVPGLVGSLSATRNIVVDSTVPTVVNVFSPVADGTYDISDEITIMIEFSRLVVVVGVPELILNVNADLTRTAVYVDGSDTTTLRFVYTPQRDDNTQNVALDIFDENSLILRPLLDGMEYLQDPAQILCQSANPILSADLMLPVPGVAVRADAVHSLVGNSQKIFVRTDGFRVRALQADVSNGVYSPGQRIVISVVFTGAIVVQGSPRIQLNSNTATYATYIGGTGTASIQFEYIVATGDSCLVLEAASQTALELNQGSISDINGIYAPLRLGAPGEPDSLSYKCNIEITSTPPVVQRVYSKTSNGNYGVGDSLQLAVELSRSVALQNPLVGPSLLLQFDGGARSATYVSGDQSTTLVFTIRIQNGDSSTKLDYAGVSALTGSVAALATTPVLTANLALPIPGQVGSLSDSNSIGIVSTPPTVTNVTSAVPNGTYGLSDRISLQVWFSFPVYVSTTAAQSCKLTLSIGDIEYRKAKYVGGSETQLLDLVYTVQSGDHSAQLDYASADSLQCTILQSTAVPSLVATNTLPLPGTKGSLSFTSSLRIDSSAPWIVSVSSGLANGDYGAGQEIDVTVTFSEAVLVPNAAVLRLKLAVASNAPVDASTATEPFAVYSQGSGTNVLTFWYTTREGDMALPLEYVNIDALTLSPSTAAMSSAIDQYRLASLRLPTPGSTGSLSNNRDIHIDTLESPRVLSVGTPMTDGIYTAGDTISISVTFSAPVTVAGPNPTLQLETGNPTTTDVAKSAIYSSGSGTNVLLFEYAVQVGDDIDRLEYRRCPVSERSAPDKRVFDKLVFCSSSANALQLGGVGSSIKRTATVPVTDAVLDLPEVNEWAEIRYATSFANYEYVDQVEPSTGIVQGDVAVETAPVNEFTILQQKTAIDIYTNGIPDHDSELLSLVKEQKYFIELDRFPKQSSRPLSALQAPNGLLGIFLNGILFKSNGEGLQSTDSCGGAIDAEHRYVYVGLPTCFLSAAHEPRSAVPSQTQPPSIMVGYAFDGFPIYGYYNENGELPNDLDECHGRIRLDGQYGYHLVPTNAPGASPFMPCLKGVDSTTPTRSQLSVFRYPVDISAIEGLSLSELSHFSGFVIDENPTTLNTVAWLNPKGVSVEYTASSVVVRSTGVPFGTRHGPFPNAYNKFSVYEQDYVFQFPRDPVTIQTTTALPQDIPIGVMLNGVPFFNSNSDKYGGNVLSSANAAYVLLDKCNGLVDAGGDYRYYGSPDCLLAELGDQPGKPSPLVGFAFDGFPLYGPYSESGQAPTDLDDCNGRTGDDGTYRYHVTLTPPYLLGCFRGTPSIDQVSLNAATDLYRSLSYAHAIRINTDQPQVAHVFTNKRPGLYVAGDSIDVAVQWSVPVNVNTTGGLPSLSIQNSSRVAVFDASRSSSTQSEFLFTVNSNDVGLEDFSYDPRVAIALNGARITRVAMQPVLDADLTLIPFDLDDITLMRTRTSGLSSKFQLISDVQVNLRGLYHPRANDLRTRIFHGQRQSVIFDGCCDVRDAFGIPDTPDVLTNRAQLLSETRNPTSGVGWDYSFKDFEGVKNLARDGGATAIQSSTSGKCEAMNAIDGIIRDVSVNTQTVARTLSSPDEDESTWWELRLVDSSTIGTVRIWLPDRDPGIPATVFTLHVNSNDGIAPVTGGFTLVFTTADGKQQLTTDIINYNAVAMIADENVRVTTLGIGVGESIQAKLLALSQAVPRLFITREPRTATMSPNGAFTWHITFLDNARPDSSVTEAVPLVLSTGLHTICGGTGIVKLETPAPIDDDSDPIVYRNEKPAKPSASTAVRYTDQSMFPFWVMLFESSAVMNIETFADAYNRSIFSYRVDRSQENRTAISVVPPSGTKAQYVRIVAGLPHGVLTIAEVEVFAEQTHVLSQYSGGTPVRAAYFPDSKTWSPEDPFGYTFDGMSSEGLWTLTITDMAVNGSDLPGSNATAGGISDWTLSITNQAGETHIYYMDFQAQLHALPRHGTLYVALNETERDHLDVDGNGLLDSIEADTYLQRYSPNNYVALPSLTRDRELTNFLMNYETFGGIEVLRDPSERQKRLPSLVCDAACLASIKMDPFFYVGLRGDTALKLLRVVGDRVVKYVPQAGFRGMDAFTFSVAVAGQDSRVLGTIQLTVRECEDKDCRMASFFVYRSAR